MSASCYALYAAMQFMFSPVLGVLSDRFGRRPVLLISLAGAAVDYLLMAFAPELWMLVVGRAIAGLTSANMAVATAYITDITPEEQRAQRFGLFHAMFGIGFIIGPVLGGVLGDIWVRAPFIAAGGAQRRSISSLALFVLPESRPGQPRRAVRSRRRSIRCGRSAGRCGLRALLPLIAVFFVLNFVGQVYGTVWALFGQDAFQWNGLMVGLSLGGYGLFHAIVQAFLPGPVVERLGERNAMLIGLACEVARARRSAFATQGWVMFAVMPLFALGGVGNAGAAVADDAAGRCRQPGPAAGRARQRRESVASIFGPLFFADRLFRRQPELAGADLARRRRRLSARDSPDFGDSAAVGGAAAG